MSKIFSIYGASGFGREILTFARWSAQSLNEKICFVDDQLAGGIINGVEVFSYKEFLDYEASERYICIAIADSKTRHRLSEQCEQDDVRNWSLSASNVVIGDEVLLGEGAILCPFTCITCNVQIGKFFHANIYSYIAHDCVIGNYVTFAPAVKCNGNVIIEDGAYIGTGAIIKQGNSEKPLVIGENAIVGMGAVVTKSVPAGAVVVGNPAKPFNKKTAAQEPTFLEK